MLPPAKGSLTGITLHDERLVNAEVTQPLSCLLQSVGSERFRQASDHFESQTRY